MQKLIRMQINIVFFIAGTLVGLNKIRGTIIIDLKVKTYIEWK